MTKTWHLALPLLTLAALTMAVLAAKPVARPAPVAQVTVAVAGLHCQACPTKLQKDLARLPGVGQVLATLDPPRVIAWLDGSRTPVSRLVIAIASHPQLMAPR